MCSWWTSSLWPCSPSFPAGWDSGPGLQAARSHKRITSYASLHPPPRPPPHSLPPPLHTPFLLHPPPPPPSLPPCHLLSPSSTSGKSSKLLVSSMEETSTGMTAGRSLGESGNWENWERVRQGKRYQEEKGNLLMGGLRSEQVGLTLSKCDQTLSKCDQTISECDQTLIGLPYLTC